MDNLKFLADAVFLMFLGPLASAQDIKITDAYARSAGKMAKSGAAFLVIENLSGTEDRLMEVWSDAAKRVQLHTCLLYTSPSPRDKRQSRMPSSA